MSNNESEHGGMLEVLQGFKINDETIDLFVTSNGCTTKESFRIDVNTRFTGQQLVDISVFRVQPDTCKMMPHVVQVAFTKKELGISGAFETVLNNKFGNTSQGR